jgi:hypothetical protein
LIDRLQELTMIVREIDRNVETAYINLQSDIEKWRKRKSMANFSYILSVYVFKILRKSIHQKLKLI